MRVLRLMEDFSHQEVHHAVTWGDVQRWDDGLDIELYPHLPQVSVQTTRAGDYLTLLSGRTA